MKSNINMVKHRWQFVPRFKKHAFGWRSQPAMQRIKQAIAEINKTAKKDPLLAADGAVLFLEKISPALAHVDSSSGAIGNAVNKAIETLVPIIVHAPAIELTRQKWLERLWAALQHDEIPYIEYLQDFWGDLCITPHLATIWVDEFIGLVRHIWSSQATGCYFKGTIPCLAALFTAKRYQELLELLEHAPVKMWHYRRWGVKALWALNKPHQAIKYAESAKGLNDPITSIAKTCEELLLSSGLVDEAYNLYALDANQSTTNLATFRAIVKKYPNKAPETILQDLIASQPGLEGKWFAAAKSIGLLELAIRLVEQSPADPHTLMRTAKEFKVKNPSFAIAAGMASLNWIMKGYGYEIANIDVLTIYHTILESATVANIDKLKIQADLKVLLDTTPNNLVATILSPYLYKHE